MLPPPESIEIAEKFSRDRRHISESLTEEEPAVFDLLTKPEPKLAKAEEIEVKKVARELLTTLMAE